MALRSVGTECYLKLEPQWRRQGSGEAPTLTGVKVAGVSQRPPKSGYSIKIGVNIPAHVFKPVIAEVVITAPEKAVECHVAVLEEDDE